MMKMQLAKVTRKRRFEDMSRKTSQQTNDDPRRSNDHQTNISTCEGEKKPRIDDKMAHRHHFVNCTRKPASSSVTYHYPKRLTTSATSILKAETNGQTTRENDDDHPQFKSFWHMIKVNNKYSLDCFRSLIVMLISMLLVSTIVDQFASKKSSNQVYALQSSFIGE